MESSSSFSPVTRAVVTALCVACTVPLGAFWMFTMLLGLEGSGGEEALVANIVWTLFIIAGSGLVGWKGFTFLTGSKGISSAWVALLLVIGVPLCSALLLFFGGLALADSFMGR